MDIIEVSDLDMAFGGAAMKILPDWNDIPEDFRQCRTKWNRIFSDWFFHGLDNAQFKPKPGIDADKALRMIRAVMGSYEPKHEHKDAGVAYMLSEFFEDVTYDNPR